MGKAVECKWINSVILKQVSPNTLGSLEGARCFGNYHTDAQKYNPNR